MASLIHSVNHALVLKKIYNGAEEEVRTLSNEQEIARRELKAAFFELYQAIELVSKKLKSFRKPRCNQCAVVCCLKSLG